MPIALSADAGSGATVADRHMAGGGGADQVHYRLYQNTSYSIAWVGGFAGRCQLAVRETKRRRCDDDLETSRRILGEVGEFAPRNEPCCKLFAIK